MMDILSEDNRRRNNFVLDDEEFDDEDADDEKDEADAADEAHDQWKVVIYHLSFLLEYFYNEIWQFRFVTIFFSPTRLFSIVEGKFC